METAARRLRDEDGNVLITVILVSMVVGMLASLALTTGTQAQRSSASDRNHEQALGVAEAGLHQVISRLTDQATNPPGAGAPDFWALAPGATSPASCAAGGECIAARDDATGHYRGSGPQGTYWFWVTRTTNGFIIDAQSTAAADTSLERGRHVQVTMDPPLRFPGDTSYALFSYTSIDIQNNDQVLDGDVFANDNITINSSNHNTASDPTLRGSLTAARGWINFGSGVYVTGNAWSGGANVLDSNATKRWAMRLAGGATVAGWAKASNAIPGPCADQHYDVEMANNSRILGALTTLGMKEGGGIVGGALTQNTCSAAAPAQPLPTFTFNPDNYDPATFHSFATVAAFQTWLASNAGNFQGTFAVLNEPAPSQTAGRYIDLTGVSLTGSATIVTNAPVYTGSMNDSTNTSGGNLVIVSHYQPANSTSCNIEHDHSDCAVHIKNNFSLDADGKCRTATLVYADKGPVAIKNGGTTCGSVISDGILIKNGLTLTYDSRIDRIVGFGPSTYAVSRWQELPAR